MTFYDRVIHISVSQNVLTLQNDPFIQPIFTQCLMCVRHCHDTQDRAVNKTDKNICPHGTWWHTKLHDKNKIKYNKGEFVGFKRPSAKYLFTPHM